MVTNYVRDPIMLSPDRRVTVSYDQFADFPDLDLINTFPITHNNRYVKLPAGRDWETFDALREQFDDQYDVADEDAVAKLEDVLIERGVPFIRRTFTDYRDVLGTYLVWATAGEGFTVETVSSCADEYQTFINGEVYVVDVERLVIYADVTDPVRLFERWEVVESVGGVTFRNVFDDKEVLEVADVHV